MKIRPLSVRNYCRKLYNNLVVCAIQVNNEPAHSTHFSWLIWDGFSVLLPQGLMWYASPIWLGSIHTSPRWALGPRLPPGRWKKVSFQGWIKQWSNIILRRLDSWTKLCPSCNIFMKRCSWGPIFLRAVICNVFIMQWHLRESGMSVLHSCLLLLAIVTSIGQHTALFGE